MSAEEITELANQLEANLEEGFEKKLLIGGLRVLQDKENPIRINLFAMAIRELFTHVLHKLSPDEQVRNCQWFVANENEGRPTRRQRATYATQGGMADELVNRLGIDATEIHRRCVTAFEELNKRVHVRPNTLVSDEKEIAEFAVTVLKAFCDLFDVVLACRNEIEAAILDAVTREAFDALTESTISELDELSTHTYVEGPVIENINVTSIDAKYINYRVTGEVEVVLNYGSGSDFRRGDGVSMSDSYPFELTMRAPVVRVDRFEDKQCAVDNSSFYE